MMINFRIEGLVSRTLLLQTRGWQQFEPHVGDWKLRPIRRSLQCGAKRFGTRRQAMEKHSMFQRDVPAFENELDGAMHLLSA